VFKIATDLQLMPIIHKNKQMFSSYPGLRSWRVLGPVVAGHLTTLGVGVGFFCSTPEVQLDHFLYHTPKLGIPVEVQFLLKLC